VDVFQVDIDWLNDVAPLNIYDMFVMLDNEGRLVGTEIKAVQPLNAPVSDVKPTSPKDDTDTNLFAFATALEPLPNCVNAVVEELPR
jgi:hypothetical protein